MLKTSPLVRCLATLTLAISTLSFAAQTPLPAVKAPATPTASPSMNSVASPAKAQPVAAASLPAGGHALNSADLEAFFDGILPMQLERSDIAGATVLVMKDGQVLLQKGYGYTDFKKKTPVDPATSVFRLASISKLSTWIAVMQLEEQGKLDIDADVNRYLDFQIRPAFDKPITLRNLMTHTGGFEEESKDILLTDPKYAISLREFLIQNQPERLYAPGTVPGYSNYGVGLASYIVQRVSGEPFEQYTERHIYTPLKMMHSTFYQPLPKGMTASEGYRGDTSKPPVGFEIFNPVGAGGYSSTAPDMGRLGQALLNGGELDGVRILKAETLYKMWMPQFQASKDLPPACMGFYQTWRNNLRWIGHEGDLIAFHSLFFVEPAHNLVLFVSYNSAGSEVKSRPEIINMFSDRYYPATEPNASLKYLTLSREELKAIEGTYVSSRRADSTKLRLQALLSQRSLSINKDGQLVLEGAKDLRGHAVKLRPIGKDLWQSEDGEGRIFAIRDANNKIVRIAVEFPGVQLERVPWYESNKLILPLAGGSLFILVLVLLATLIRTVRRVFLRKRPKLAPQPGTAWLSFGAKTAAWLWVFLFVGVFCLLASQGDDLMPPTPAWDFYFLVLNWVIAVILFFSLLALVSGLRVWTRQLRWITKVKFTLVALACCFLSWFSVHYHFLGQIHRI